MRKHLTAALIFVLLTLVLTNPLILHIWNSVEDKQDGLLNTWIVAWVGHALITDPLNLYNTNIFFPYTNTLAFSEILLPPSLLALPLNLATNNTIFGYNVALLAMLWLDAFGMYLFVVNLTNRAEAGWIAGTIYAFNPFNLGNLAQMQLLTLGFLPLALLFLRKLLGADEYNGDGGQKVRAGDGEDRDRHAGDRYGDRSVREWKFAFLFALFFILQSLSSFYYALLAGFAVGTYLVWWLVTQRVDLVIAVRRVIVRLVASAVLIAAVLIPFLLPYFQVQRELGFSRTVQESEPFSASLKQFAEVSPNNMLYGGFLAPNPLKRVGGYPLDNLFPGVVAVVLAVAGIIASRARVRWFLIVLVLVSFILALGPRLYLTSSQATDIPLPYRWLYDLFTPLRALRAPVRFDALINLALAGLAGLGAAALLTRFATGRARIVPVVVVLVIALEYVSQPAANIVPLPVANEIPEVYKWLAQQPHGVTLELPMMGPNDKKELDISTQYYSTYHWQDTPDGYSGFIPPRRGEIAYEVQSFPSIRAMGLLRALGVKYVIDYSPVSQCYVFLGPVGYYRPIAVSGFLNPCIYEFTLAADVKPDLSKQLYVPGQVAAGAKFNAYLILKNNDFNAYGVKPTEHAQARVSWNDGRTETVVFPIPVVTSSVSVVPVPLTAPSHTGAVELRLTGEDAVIGTMNVNAFVHVGNELARETVLPASVEMSEPLNDSYMRGDTIQVALSWFPLNKINAYYSASVRLVNEKGDKVANVDRQPILETLLWRPENPVEDTFALGIPVDIPPGNYRVEVIMYQADTDFSALLLDKDFVPQQSIVLGEIQVK